MTKRSVAPTPAATTRVEDFSLRPQGCRGLSLLGDGLVIATNSAEIANLGEAEYLLCFCPTADDSFICFDCVFERNKLKSEKFQRTSFESNVSPNRITLPRNRPRRPRPRYRREVLQYKR